MKLGSVWADISVVSPTQPSTPIHQRNFARSSHSGTPLRHCSKILERPPAIHRSSSVTPHLDYPPDLHPPRQSSPPRGPDEAHQAPRRHGNEGLSHERCSRRLARFSAAGNRSPKVMAKALSAGFHRAMLVGLSVMGQRHHAVMEVVSGGAGHRGGPPGWGYPGGPAARSRLGRDERDSLAGLVTR